MLDDDEVETRELVNEDLASADRSREIVVSLYFLPKFSQRLDEHKI